MDPVMSELLRKHMDIRNTLLYVHMYLPICLFNFKTICYLKKRILCQTACICV